MATQYLLGLRLLAMKFVSYLVALGPMPVRMGGVKYVVHPKTGRLMPAVAGSSPDDPADPGKDDPANPGKDDPDPDDADDPADPGKDDEPDWKSESRKHEKRSKAEKKRADELEARLKKIEESNQTDQEKAIQKAKEEAKAEAQTEAEAERRETRLEAAVTRLANKGVKVKDETLKFADSDDALVWIQKRIKSGDIEPDDIFDGEGKVQTDALASALGEILEERPHLAGGGGNPLKPGGSADGGAGGGGGKDLDDMSVEDHFSALKRNK